MTKLALIATVEVAPEKRDQVLSQLAAHGARSLRDEPGTLHFDILVRHFQKPRIEDFLRITVGTDDECGRLIGLLRQTV
ncbi:MAG: antibiotic biosynthesis monooxygenase [Bradyrhizobium sp.]